MLAMPSRARRRDSAAPPNPTPAPSHYAGQIMWLPPREDITANVNLDLGCYNHPVVILSPKPVDQRIVILIVSRLIQNRQTPAHIKQATSFNDTDLSVRHPHNQEQRSWYLPIHPSKRHPDLNVLLKLQGGLTLRKNSYICTRQQHTIPLAALRTYERERPNVRFVLKSGSYQTLIERAGFTAPVELPSDRILLPPPVARDVVRDGIDRTPLLNDRLYAQQVALGRAHGHGVSGQTPTTTERRYQLSETARAASLHDETTPLSREARMGLASPYGASYGTSYGAIPHHYPPAPSHAARRPSYLPPPTPHTSHSRSRRRTNGSSSGVWSNSFQTFLALVFTGALFGAGFFGLWKAWVHRAELVQPIWQGGWWAVVNAFRTGRAVVVGVLRGLWWVVVKVGMAGREVVRWLGGSAW